MKIDYKAVVKEILDSRKENGGIHAIYFAACGGSKAGLTTADFFLKCESATIDSHVYTAKEFVLCPPKAFDENCIVVTLSASGTTPEAVAAAKAAKEKGAVSITIVGRRILHLQSRETMYSLMVMSRSISTPHVLWQ